MKRVLAVAGVLLISPVTLAAVITGPTSAMTAPSSVALQEIPDYLLGIYMGASITCPGLPWQVLAGIGWVESRHGSGRVDPSTGQVDPPIIGPAIDGRAGVAAIPDPSQPDGWAHAIGPMQFLPTTWQQWGRLAPDRPPDALPDPQNAWDAIYSAAAYLCGDAGQVNDLRSAILRYNQSQNYVQDVLSKAHEYGLGSGTTVDGSTVTGSGDAVVAAAMTQLGVAYVWGGETPGVGFDCSGLVQWAYLQIGVSLPRTTSQQVLSGVRISDLATLRPGDLIFTSGLENGVTTEFGHVAIYAGGGMEIVAPKTGDVVSLRAVAFESVQAVRRILS